MRISPKLPSPITTVLVTLISLVVVLMVAGSAWASEPFQITKFENTITNEGGTPDTQAGSHPYAMATTIELAAHEHEGVPTPDGEIKELEIGLPAGVAVNAQATKKCAEAELDTTFHCPNATVVGVVTLKLGLLVGGLIGKEPVYNMVAPPGTPAEFAFVIGGAGVVVHIYGNTQTGGDYGLSARVSDVLERGHLDSSTVTLWGDPTAPSHDEERGACLERGRSCPVARRETPLLTLPTACTGQPLVATIGAASWQEPDNHQKAEATSPAITGCEDEALAFEPSLSVGPTEPEAASTESPTGLEVALKLPQEESLTGLATSDMKEAAVTLPPGLTVSPSAANGLGVCSEAQIGLTNDDSPTCPDNSKLGTVEIVTPLLEVPLKGSVYLAQQGNLPDAGANPFGSLFALYLVAEGNGALVKLPGKIELNAATGQLTARFGEDPATTLSTGTKQFLPQLPFNELRMRFFGGSKAPLVTPSSCGTFTTSSVLTPWDGHAPAEPSSPFTVGAGCGAFGFAPSFTAGTVDNQAGEHTSFGMTLSRNDGEQRLAGVSVTTPRGLLGTLKNVVQCGETQASRGECGQASEIGETTVAVGPGADPYWVKGGKVYLTGPYNNGPFGLSIVVPTTAGPFTLTGNGGPGREVVRASIRVNPSTSQITVVSDPLPSILEGVPLDIRTVDVNVNRPGFMFNPTSCAALSVTGTITSESGASAAVSSPFQAANCAALPFKPSFTVSTKAKTSKANGASLTVKVGSSTGQANIAKVRVALPKQLPSWLPTLQKACPDTVFDENPANCPAGSVVGSATASTPVLAHPLTGPAYLVSHGGVAFPDLVIVLQGEGIVLYLDGNTDIKKGITTSTFNSIPDAPVSSFELSLPQGPGHVLATDIPTKAKGSLCGQSLVMPTTITGQNGAVITQTTKIAVTDCPKIKKKAKAKKRKVAKKAKRHKA
jgi:hypothetical protein